MPPDEPSDGDEPLEPPTWPGVAPDDDDTEYSMFEKPVDSALGRFSHGWPGPRQIKDPALRRAQGIELIIVLLMFPLLYVWNAVVALIEQMQGTGSVVRGGVPNIHGVWLATALEVFRVLIPTSVAALVLYLLWRGGEGARSINLDLRRWRMDLALLLPVFLILELLALVVSGIFFYMLGVRGYSSVSPSGIPRLAYTSVNLASSIDAGIVEEIVVLGYLVRRLEQRGYGPGLVVLIAVAVRVSYHLYYGWGALSIAVWALASVLLYRRIRRLWPFIICHVCYDAAVAVVHTYPGAFATFSVVTFLSTLVMFFVWRRWTPEDPSVSASSYHFT